MLFCFSIVFQVLVAITHGSDSAPTFEAFDVVSKSWKPLSYMNKPQTKALCLECSPPASLAAEQIGNHLYVAVDKYNVYCYSIDQNSWEDLPRSPCPINSLCAIGDYMYALSDYNQVSQRYSFSECRWQPIAKLSDCSNTECCYSAGTTVFDSKLYVLFGHAQRTEGNNTRGYYDLSMQKAMLYCFDPSMNRWEFLSNTREPHFGSTLFVVNNKLCVAGGRKSVNRDNNPSGENASVEVTYNAEMCYWITVPQSHIPQNNLHAIEVEGRVYFIIDKFPIDSGIRIPPEEQYPVYLGEWDKLTQIRFRWGNYFQPADQKTILCYLPVKRKP